MQMTLNGSAFLLIHRSLIWHMIIAFKTSSISQTGKEHTCTMSDEKQSSSLSRIVSSCPTFAGREQYLLEKQKMLQTGNARHPFYAFRGCYSLHNIEIPWIGREYPTPILPQEEWGTSWRANRHTWHPSSSYIYKHPSQRNAIGSLSFPYHAPTMAGDHTLRPSAVLLVAAPPAVCSGQGHPSVTMGHDDAWQTLDAEESVKLHLLLMSHEGIWEYREIQSRTLERKKIALIQGCSRSCKCCSDYTIVVY